jgi:hypothetical protein
MEANLELDGTNIFLKNIEFKSINDKEKKPDPSYTINIFYKGEIYKYTESENKQSFRKPDNNKIPLRKLCKLYIQIENTHNINTELIQFIIQKLSEANIANNILCIYRRSYIDFSIDFNSSDTYISGKAYNQTNHYASFNLDEIKDRAQHIFGRVYVYHSLIVHICSMIVPEDSNILVSECSRKNIPQFINLLKALVINPPNILFNSNPNQRIFNFFISIGNDTGSKSGALYDSEFKNLAGQNNKNKNIIRIDGYNYKMHQNIGKFIFVPSYSYVYNPDERKHTQYKLNILYSINNNILYKYATKNPLSQHVEGFEYIYRNNSTTNFYIFTDNETNAILLKKNIMGGYQIIKFNKKNQSPDVLFNDYQNNDSDNDTINKQVNDNFGNENYITEIDHNKELSERFNKQFITGTYDTSQIKYKTELNNFNLIINTNKSSSLNDDLEYFKLIDILFGL